MRASQPKHAQPSVLAGLHWSSLSAWVGIALLVTLGLGILATVDAPAPPAAARAVAPPAIATTGSSGQPDGDGPPADEPPGGVSIAPSPTTFIRPPAGSPLSKTGASSLAADGIPTTALQAYQQAAARERRLSPACGLTWPLLAGIGRAESDHGRFAGAALHADGISTPRIIGIPLNGNGTTRILDTDAGLLDGDTVYDRAVGPMQFIPSTWQGYGVDANHDGFTDPFNIFDAAAAAARYLCSTGGDLTTLAGQMAAVRVYNDSDAYISAVLQLEAIYASGVPGLTVPIVPADPNPSPPRVSGPPANPGPPLDIPHQPKPKPEPKPKPSPKTTAPSTRPSTQTESPCPTPSAATSSSTATSSDTATASAAPSDPASTECPTPTTTDSTTDGGTPTPSDTSTSRGTTTPTDTGTSPGAPASS